MPVRVRVGVCRRVLVHPRVIAGVPVVRELLGLEEHWWRFWRVLLVLDLLGFEGVGKS